MKLLSYLDWLFSSGNDKELLKVLGIPTISCRDSHDSSLLFMFFNVKVTGKSPYYSI